MPSTGETRCVRSSGVEEGSAVCVTVGGVVSTGVVGEAPTRVFVGSGIEVGSITGACVRAQAVRKIKATTMKFFITSNYMSVHVVAKRSTSTRVSVNSAIMQHPVTQKGFGCERILLKRRLLACAACSTRESRRFAARNDTGYGVAPTKLSAYSASSYPGRTERAVRQSSIAPFVFP